MVASNLPSLYQRDYFFGEYVLNKTIRMRLDQNNLPLSTENLVTNASSPVHIRVGPDGALYYASLNTSTIFRLAYVGGSNQAPVAVATALPSSGLAPLPVQFDGSDSFDPDGGNITFSWFWGDEKPGSGSISPQHTYMSNGVFLPVLSVSDGQATRMAPHVEPGVVGIKRDIEAITPQLPGDGHTYSFASWSDGGVRLHTITTPAVSTTFTARFTCNLLAEATDLNITPGAGGSITLSWAAPKDPCLSLGPAVYHVYASSMATPFSPPGQFPLDPSFTLVASTATNSVTITPAAGPQFYLVLGIGSDGNEGPVGAYGQ